MPTRIIFNSKHSIVVSESLEDVEQKLNKARNSMDTVIFNGYDGRYGDPRILVVPGNVDYCRPERVRVF